MIDYNDDDSESNGEAVQTDKRCLRSITFVRADQIMLKNFVRVIRRPDHGPIEITDDVMNALGADRPDQVAIETVERYSIPESYAE